MIEKIKRASSCEHFKTKADTYLKKWHNFIHLLVNTEISYIPLPFLLPTTQGNGNILFLLSGLSSQ